MTKNLLKDSVNLLHCFQLNGKNYFPRFHDKTNHKIGLYIKI